MCFKTKPTASFTVTANACLWWSELPTGRYVCTAKELYVYLIIILMQHSKYLWKFLSLNPEFLIVLVVLQDNVIFERLTEASQYKELTVAHLEQFATEGKKEKLREGEDGSRSHCWVSFCLKDSCLFSWIAICLCVAFLIDSFSAT